MMRMLVQSSQMHAQGTPETFLIGQAFLEHLHLNVATGVPPAGLPGQPCRFDCVKNSCRGAEKL